MQICGDCLHAKECHSENNGHFMLCSACNKLCDIEQFNTEFKPSDIQTISVIQFAREFKPYTPKECGVDLVK